MENDDSSIGNDGTEIPEKNGDKKFDKLLRSVYNSNYKPKIRNRIKRTPKEQQHIKDAIKTVLSEYLDCFIIFGFDPDGQESIIVKTSSSIEQRAIGDLLEDYMTMAEQGYADPISDEDLDDE